VTARAREAVAMWLCVDCHLTAVGYSAEELGGTPDREPLALLGEYGAGTLTPGLSWAEHDGDCAIRAARANVDDCGCEHRPFSGAECDGCGSQLAGSRDAWTLWGEL
jgi:hypothetical protein